MKTDFDQELEKIMTEEKEIPAHVRKRLDSTYTMIQGQAKRKKNRAIWKRVAAAACALLITGAVLTNEQVRASINDFFNFGDKGIEQAVSQGFSEENDSTATDQNINIALKQNFSDANKIGMSFELEFGDPTVLEDGLREFAISFRLKNGDGEYITGESMYTSGSTGKNQVLDVKAGIVQYDAILESNKGLFPNLKDAVVEIESILIFPDYDPLKMREEFGEEFDVPVTIIDGKWDLALANQDESKQVSTFEYVMKDSKSDIQVISAIASPTSLNMTLIVDEEPFGSEGQYMKMIDEKGTEYGIDGYNMETKNGKTTVGVNFQISSYNNAKKLRLVIDNVGEVELIKK